MKLLIANRYYVAHYNFLKLRHEEQSCCKEKELDRREQIEK